MRYQPWVVLTAVAFLNVPGAARAEVDASGAFNHTVPIKLPAAVGGVQPELALSYTSHGGNGLMGMGWELDGLPVIGRLSYGAGINYNAGDTYIGPQGRLVRVDAANGFYRTEEESWGKYVAYRCSGSVWTGGEGDGGPCMWRLTQSNGDVLEFGGTEDSRIQAVGRGGAIREWALSKYTDTAGNFYTVSYFEDTTGGDYRPTVVTYNQGNGRTKLYTVEFSYEDRPDRVLEYSQSAAVYEDRRLKWITVESGGQLIRKYRLDYEAGPATNHSRLLRVQEYGRDGVSTRPPETFAYEAGTFSVSRERWANAQGTGSRRTPARATHSGSAATSTAMAGSTSRRSGISTTKSTRTCTSPRGPDSRCSAGRTRRVAGFPATRGRATRNGSRVTSTVTARRTWRRSGRMLWSTRQHDRGGRAPLARHSLRRYSAGRRRRAIGSPPTRRAGNSQWFTGDLTVMARRISRRPGISTT